MSIVLDVFLLYFLKCIEEQSWKIFITFFKYIENNVKFFGSECFIFWHIKIDLLSFCYHLGMISIIIDLFHNGIVDDELFYLFSADRVVVICAFPADLA